MYDRTYGSNFNREMSTTDVAKQVRSWITAQKKAGHFPKELKVSVRSQYFSGGSSIDASITQVPADWDLFNREWFETVERHGFCALRHDCAKYSAQVEKIRAEVKAYIDSFNYDGSETQVDYFDVNFYFHGVEIDWRNYSEVERAYRESIKAEIEAEQVNQ